METELLKNFSKDGVKIIWYADDFVIMGKKLEDIIKAKGIVIKFLKKVNLKLSEEKTRIGHSMISLEGDLAKPGLDFWGYHFRNIQTFKHRGVKNTRGVKQPYIQVPMPSMASVKKHRQAIRDILKKHRNTPLEAVIVKLASRIDGWARYFSITKCTKYFAYMDKWLFWALWRWSIKRYKTAKKAIKKCFSVQGWKFGFRSGLKTYILKRHDQTNVRRYVKIKAGASIYSREILYFCNRMSMHNDRIKRLLGLMKSQKFKCKHCERHFMPNDLIELHHVLGETKTRTEKMEFLHKHGHDRVHGSNK